MEGVDQNVLQIHLPFPLGIWLLSFGTAGFDHITVALLLLGHAFTEIVDKHLPPINLSLFYVHW